MKSTKVRQCCENSMEMYMIQFYKKILHFYLFWSHVLFLKNCDFYNNIIMKSNHGGFLQVVSIHISFSIKFLLTYVSYIASKVLKMISIYILVSYHTPTYITYRGHHTPSDHYYKQKFTFYIDFLLS